MISRSTSNTACALAATIAVLVFAAPASAASRCGSRVDGTGTGQGILGLGTENARSAAVSSWASKVNSRWGIYYANFDNARGVRWNCKKGAIIQARCTVSAIPCRK